jgi:environmental stress-induced protein Ves
MILRSEDYKRMPWKNGGGETLEIAVFPQGASVGNFDWRISMATVSADGGFSTFPGIDRIITILDGDAITLSIEGRSPVLLDQASEPYAFPGDVATMGRLRAGTIADLNLMVRRGLDHSVTRIDIRDLSEKLASRSTQFLMALEAMEFQAAAEGIALRRLDCIDLSDVSPADIAAGNSAAGLLITIAR